MTRTAGILQYEIQFFLASEDSLLKCDPNTLSDISTLHRTVAATSPCAASEQISKNISKNITEISAAEIKTAESAGSTGPSFEGGMAELIILTTFFGVT